MRRRWWTPTLPASTLVLAAMIAVTATPAQAALWLEFRPAAASPGTAVHARTGGQAAMADSPSVGLPLVLIPAAQADRLPRTVSTAAALRTLPGVVPVGTLQVDQQGNGTITFTVPRLPPGRYAAMLWCPACARHSSGTNVAYTGEFTVTSRRLPVTGPAVEWQAGVALGLLLVGGGLLVTSASGTRRGLPTAQLLSLSQKHLRHTLRLPRPNIHAVQSRSSKLMCLQAAELPAQPSSPSAPRWSTNQAQTARSPHRETATRAWAV